MWAICPTISANRSSRVAVCFRKARRRASRKSIFTGRAPSRYHLFFETFSERYLSLWQRRHSNSEHAFETGSRMKKCSFAAILLHPGQQSQRRALPSSSDDQRSVEPGSRCGSSINHSSKRVPRIVSGNDRASRIVRIKSAFPKVCFNQRTERYSDSSTSLLRARK